MRDTLGVLLAGGAGERLFPLTRDRAKPAVPFAGQYRIIDITLSNCINSDLRHVYILTQYKALSLNRHIREGWGPVVANELGEFIEILPPMQREISSANPERLISIAGDPTDRFTRQLDAEVERHVGLGASVVRRVPGDWTTLRDPAGREYCVTGRAPRARG